MLYIVILYLKVLSDLSEVIDISLFVNQLDVKQGQFVLQLTFNACFLGLQLLVFLF